MAYPTRITIASGRSVYEGDPDEGRGAGRQVRVSMTYQLERGDTDLLAVTAQKAREVERAQAAVWRQVNGELVNGEQTELWTDGTGTPAPPTDEDDLFWGGPADPDADPDEDRGEDPDWSGDETPPSHFTSPPPGQHSGGTGPGNVAGTRTGSGNGHDRAGDGGPQGDGSGRAPLPITKPQRLALEAQARRLGLSDVALAEVIRERFGKSSFTPRFAASLLSKAEAASLLRALSEREWEAGRQAQEGVRPAVPA